MSAHLDDERLLEWLLNPDERDADDAARLETDPDAQRRLGELDRFLLSCRDLAGQVEREEAERGQSATPLAARVLARTTREDLSLRGDLGLMLGYLRRRVEDSGWLKLAAASLLLHLIALPALAFYVFVAQPGGPRIGYLPAEEYRPHMPFPVQSPEPVQDLERPAADDDPLDGLSEDD